ncbi:NADP oxidoreductase [Geothrix oryzae]|uniref:NADP oxidoreductase n=2 Tax=Geothrix oryzae TaxID=2927975 RepID=A0ABM8DS22_9BACT|nr:NADP oxidoreductase [Geothrix oryzae]
MTFEFTILGRGHAGRSLAAAWGTRAALLDHEARPEGLVVLAVPDRAVEDLAKAFPGRCVHLAGSLHLPGVPCAHPLTSFDGEARDWTGTPLAITGAVPDALRRAFGDLGFAAFDLPAELKPLYHAAAVLTSGHAATLWLGAAALLRAQGVALPGRGLLPLAEATLRNVALRGSAGRTGPFPRGDEATIARDVEALPEPWREIFLKLGRSLD